MSSKNYFLPWKLEVFFYPGDERKLLSMLQDQYTSHINQNESELSQQAIENRQKLSWEARVKTMLDAC